MMIARLTPRIVNAMTIDVEDYFHANAFDRVVSFDQWPGLESRVCANTDRILGILDEAGVRATFFVLGWVAERFPALVQRIARGGHEIASHSYRHRLVYELSPEQFREDLRRAKSAIEAAAQVPVFGYRAPSYSVTARSLWALDILAEEGYAYDASIFPIHHDRYGIPRSPRHAFLVEAGGAQLLEIPGSTARWAALNVPVGGGGYFRLLPYAVTRWGISQLNRREQRPVVFYLHPWELDPAQPRLPVRHPTRWRHYHNLDRTEARFRRLLGEFRFDSVFATLLEPPVRTATAPMDASRTWPARDRPRTRTQPRGPRHRDREPIGAAPGEAHAGLGRPDRPLDPRMPPLSTHRGG
jgi:polysaccharide deacetylase family protein (PEP-CTERM system associated)